MADAPFVGPPEELMKEHGLFNRILLIYKNLVIRHHKGMKMPLNELKTAAIVVRTFMHDYHEEMEETYIFERMKNLGMYEDLTETLLDQHHAGKQITDRVLLLSSDDEFFDPEFVARDLAAFITMYHPHEAREDTVLFPAWRNTLMDRDFARITEEMAAAETKLLGPHAFATALRRIDTVERNLGINDLNQFTAKS